MRKSLIIAVVVFNIIARIEVVMAQSVPSTSAQLHDLTNRRQLAQALFKEERFAEAAEQLKGLLNSGLQESFDHYWLGESYYHLGRFGEAATSFRQAAKLNPRMDEAKVRMVEAYLASQNMSEARTACAEALATVNNAYAKQQLLTMSQIANKTGPLFPQLKLNDTVETPNNGKR